MIIKFKIKKFITYINNKIYNIYKKINLNFFKKKDQTQSNLEIRNLVETASIVGSFF